MDLTPEQKDAILKGIREFENGDFVEIDPETMQKIEIDRQAVSVEVLLKEYCDTNPEHLDRDGTRIELPLDQWIENQKDEKGNLSLSYQVRFPDIALLRQILKMGVDVNFVDSDKKTGLIMLLSKRHVNTGAVEVLLSAGADVNKPEGTGKTPAMFAAENSSCLDLLGSLYKHGADLLATDVEGRTVLMWANMGKASPNQITLLIPYSDPGRKDIYGMTARDYEKKYRKESWWQSDTIWNMNPSSIFWRRIFD